MIKPIPGYEGMYEIADTGEVYSCERIIYPANKGGKPRHLRRRRLTPKVDNRGRKTSKGYKEVYLSKDGATKAFPIHRLLATVFIPNPDNKPYVNHIDGDKHNNALTNLEWCTHRENTDHAVKHGLTPRKPVIRSDGKTYESVNAAADDIGTLASCITRVLTGKRKTHKGYSYKYLPKEDSHV